MISDDKSHTSPEQRAEWDKLQKKYSNKRTKWFEKISGRKVLKDGENKKGRPK